jgi:hypothetical protein
VFIIIFDSGVDGRIILKWILMNWDVGVKQKQSHYSPRQALRVKGV